MIITNKLIMKKLLLLFFVVITNIASFAQTATQANISGTTTVDQIAKSVSTVVDANIIVGSNGTISGAKVQITDGYITGANGDILALPTTAGFTSVYDNAKGLLSITGTADAAAWQAVLRKVTLTSTTASCYPEQRQIVFSLGDKYYNALTGHWYDYNSTNRNWTAAKAFAASQVFFGKLGYLATLTSQAENNFIWKIISGSPWVGGSDEFGQINTALGRTVYTSQGSSYNAASTTQSEGKYYWVTGPEAGTRISNGNTGNTPTAVDGSYLNWASGEPNNSGSEHYTQLYSANNGLWNDLPDNSQQACVIEYGGLPGDDNSSTTVFTRKITVAGSTSGSITGGGVNVCGGTNSTPLTLSGQSGSVVRWEYSYDNFYTNGVAIANTSATYTASNLSRTTYYRAIINSGGTCTSLTSGAVEVSVTPALSGNITALNNSICAGGAVNLTLSGKQGDVVKWQISTNLSTWTDIANTTTSLIEAIPTAGTYYYRAVVQIIGCGSAVNSENYPITVTSGTPPVGGSVSSDVYPAGGAAKSGTVTLSGNTGTVSKWQYSTNDGRIWSDISNTTRTYNYSGITSTTYYRAVVINGSCGTAYSSNGTVTINDVAPSSLSYTSPSSFIKDVAITPLNPTISGGYVSSYAINPSLPTGLSLNVTNGVISGTPTVSSSSVDYTVTATNSGGSTTAIVNIKVNLLDPTIGVFANVNKTFGDATYTIVAPSSNSTGAFTYSSDNLTVASISGTTVTIVGAGTATITASQAATTNYNAGTATSTIIVAKVNPTIGSFADITKSTASAAFSLSAPTSNSTGAFTYVSSNTAVATISGATVAIVGAGTTTITATQATDANYNAGTATSTLTVTLAPVVTINSTPVTTATVGSLYASPITAITNSNNPITFSSVGTLPSFLSLSSSGQSAGQQISGSTPDVGAVASDPANGNFYAVQNSNGNMNIYKITPDGTTTVFAQKI
jgi:hypothetical protein